jgi:hypothetical protein
MAYQQTIPEEEHLDSDKILSPSSPCEMISSRRKLLASIGAATVFTGAAAQSAIAASPGGQQLEGAWLTTIGTPGFAPALGLNLFTRDGIVIETNVIEVPSLPPFANGSFTVGFGEWVRTGDREFTMTFLKLITRGGTAVGVFKLRARMTLSPNLDTLSGTNLFEFFDNNSNVVLQGTGTLSSTRIGVDELPR